MFVNSGKLMGAGLASQKFGIETRRQTSPSWGGPLTALAPGINLRWNIGQRVFAGGNLTCAL
jgi:hypothetical protein